MIVAKQCWDIVDTVVAYWSPGNMRPLDWIQWNALLDIIIYNTMEILNIGLPIEERHSWSNTESKQKGQCFKHQLGFQIYVQYMCDIFSHCILSVCH